MVSQSHFYTISLADNAAVDDNGQVHKQRKPEAHASGFRRLQAKLQQIVLKYPLIREKTTKIGLTVNPLEHIINLYYYIRFEA